MQLKNTETQYGLITVILHWLFALAIICLLASGIYMVTLTYYHPWYHPLPDLHKKLGIATIILFLLRTGWHFCTQQPKMHTKHKWESWAAKATHHLMLIFSLGILISGYMIISVEVETIDWFGIHLPTLNFDLKNQADLAGFWHQYIAYGLIGLLSLHILGALKHQILDKEPIFKKILGFKEIKKP